MNVAVVVIGRNEATRLARTLRPILDARLPCVYVDSASSDDSPAIARALAVPVVTLDPSSPLSAARARNAGARWLREHLHPLDAIQFVDGDTTLDPHWLAHAQTFLDDHPDHAVVCGVLSELDHQRLSVRRLLHLEWQGPIGEIPASGGNMLVRADPFFNALGFNESYRVGEELELCARLRDQGMKIIRLDHPMGTHDSGIATFGAWWTRAIRSGVAAAQGLGIAGRARENRHVRRAVSALTASLAIPLATTLSLALLGPIALLILCAYPLLWARIALRNRSRGPRDAMLLASALLLAKFAETLGILRFLLSPASWRRPRTDIARATNRAPAESTSAGAPRE